MSAKTRDPDRLVLFTDAVVAIAVTLLILPLVELVPDARESNVAALDIITEHKSELSTFLLSFLVISNFWFGHHRLFDHVKAYTPTIMRLNSLWLLTIVFLPFPTQITGAYESSRFTAGFYTGTILVLSICQSGLTWLVSGHPTIENADNPVSVAELRSNYTLTGLTVVAFVLAAFVPGVGFYALLLLLISPVTARVYRLRHKVS